MFKNDFKQTVSQQHTRPILLLLIFPSLNPCQRSLNKFKFKFLYRSPSHASWCCGRWAHRGLPIGYAPWASYQIRKIAGCACAGNAGKVFPRRRIQRKLLVSDPGMHHGTCVTHVPWCMSGSLTRSGGENVPGIPGACAPAILLVWQEAHWNNMTFSKSAWRHTLKSAILF